MFPRIGLLTPVRAALGVWLQDFRVNHFQPDTEATAEWAQRNPEPAIAWAPARMVDAATDMLSTYRRNSNDPKVPTSGFLPVLLVAVASDYTETPGEDGRPITDKIPFAFPDDPLQQSFALRLMRVDLRAQIVVAAPDALSAQSMIGQLFLHILERGTLKADYSFAGFTAQYPARIVPTDRLAIPTPLGEQVCVLAVDLNLRASIPLFYGEGTEQAPTPFPVTESIGSEHDPLTPPLPEVTEEEWAAYFRLTSNVPGAEGPKAPGVYLAGTLDETAPK